MQSHTLERGAGPD